MASILIPPRIQFIDSNGEPIVNGYVYTFAAGTTTPKQTWKNQDESTLNVNPIRLDDQGRADIWIRGAYKIVVHDATDTLIPGYTIDNVISYSDYDFTGLTATIAELNSTNTSAITTMANYSVVIGNRCKTILANATSNIIDVSLPKLSDVPNGFKINIKKIDFSSNIVTVLPFGTEKIDNSLNQKLYDFGDFIELLNDDSEWRILAVKSRGSVLELSSTYNVTLSDDNLVLLCNPSLNNADINLPAISTVGRGFSLTIKCGALSAGFGTTLVANPPAKIDGRSAIPLTSYEAIEVKTSSTDWYIISDMDHASKDKTGEIKECFSNAIQQGWVLMDDGTIGNAFSGATSRANSDTQDLFIFLWNNIIDTYCGVYDSTGVKVARGASASLDFTANRRIELPKSKARATVGVGNIGGVYTYAAGQTGGEERHVQTPEELAAHSHLYNDDPTGGSGWGNYGDNTHRGASFVSSTGLSYAFNIVQPIIALYRFIKL